MMEGLKKLRSGDYNSVDQQVLADGSLLVILSKRRENKTYRFRVKNLDQENEEVLEHEVIEARPPQFIQDRMKNAKPEV